MNHIFKIDDNDEFQTALQEITKTLYRSEKSLKCVDTQVAKLAKDEIKQIISDSLFDINKIVQALQVHSWDPERLKYFQALLEESKSEIVYDAYIHMNSEYGETVTDFDWVLKLVLGTSDLKSLCNPILQLLLTTVNLTGDQRQITYEVHKETLCKFITELETYLCA